MSTHDAACRCLACELAVTMPSDGLPYECPDCGEAHDGMTTGTEYCPDCEATR
jgi:predicted RNA-binding Zn-ribbon protein involved in translation (DUF1610 family)